MEHDKEAAERCVGGDGESEINIAVVYLKRWWRRDRCNEIFIENLAQCTALNGWTGLLILRWRSNFAVVVSEEWKGKRIVWWIATAFVIRCCSSPESSHWVSNGILIDGSRGFKNGLAKKKSHMVKFRQSESSQFASRASPNYAAPKKIDYNVQSSLHIHWLSAAAAAAADSKGKRSLAFCHPSRSLSYHEPCTANSSSIRKPKRKLKSTL
jgi:hypothetical protein